MVTPSTSAQKSSHSGPIVSPSAKQSRSQSNQPFILSPSLKAAITYLTCSTTLTLANKRVFSAESFNFPWTILAVQSVAVVFFLMIVQRLRSAPLFSMVLLRQITPPCILFTLYLYTNSRALRHLSLPILSVLKSLAPMGVALAEFAIFGDPVTRPVILAMVLILIGNAVTLLNNPHASPVGFVWAIVNVGINIMHVLSLRLCLSADFSPVEKTLHSNLIASVIMIPVSLVNNELKPFSIQLMQTSLQFRVVFALSCLLAAAIGSSVFWLVQKTCGSTLSFVGACNKFAVVILGAVLFDTTISFVGWVSVMFGVSAGIIFAVAKTKEKEEKSSGRVKALGGEGESANRNEHRRDGDPDEELASK